jgi:hypothetical protein
VTLSRTGSRISLRRSCLPEKMLMRSHCLAAVLIAACSGAPAAYATRGALNIHPAGAGFRPRWMPLITS